MQKTKHVILLGASVGGAWEIDNLHRRNKTERYRFEFVGEYQFDKSETLRQILERKENKPDAILIKECAAYFPGNIEEYQKLMKKWVQECKDAKIIPIPTTVVPVAKPDSLKTTLKEWAKWFLRRPTFEGRLNGIVQYNDWLKNFAEVQQLVFLDLEGALRISPTDRSLRGDLHNGDGLHLNPKAYGILDKIVFPTLDKAFNSKH